MPLLETGYSKLSSSKQFRPKFFLLESPDNLLTNNLVVFVAPPGRASPSIITDQDKRSIRSSSLFNSRTNFLKPASRSRVRNNSAGENRRSPALTLICWNLLSVVLFFLAVGVSNAQSAARSSNWYDRDRTNNYDFYNKYRNKPTNNIKRSEQPLALPNAQQIDGYNLLTPKDESSSMMADDEHGGGRTKLKKNRLSNSGGSGTFSTTTRAPKLRTRLSGKTNKAQATTSDAPRWTYGRAGGDPNRQDPAADKGQCKIFDVHSLDTLCGGKISGRRRINMNKVNELWDTYLFPACLETGETSLYKFFNLQTVGQPPDTAPGVTESDLANPGKLNNLSQEFHDCLSPGADVGKCRDCYVRLLGRTAKIVGNYTKFVKKVLSKVDCNYTHEIKSYSAITTCNQCKVSARLFSIDRYYLQSEHGRVHDPLSFSRVYTPGWICVIYKTLYYVYTNFGRWW